MHPLILDGKLIAKQIKNELKVRVAELKGHGINPKLSIVMIGSYPPSLIYVSNKVNACKQLGIEPEVIQFPEETQEQEVIDTINRLNENPAVHGIILQLPLPQHIDTEVMLGLIAPNKDVDGLTPINLGRLLAGNPVFVPATPAGIVELLRRYSIKTSGKRTVIIGRGLLVGRPLANLLLRKGEYGDATIVVTHSQTKDLISICKIAEILVVAVGKPNFVTGEMINEGAVIIDAGINRTNEGIVGDVNFETAVRKSSAITPVPGGVGPMTVAMLLSNTVLAAELNSGLKTERQ